ncbi:endocuticle structural glycoprotein SgAbd-5-like [Ostrinia furnacalis]|uniref:endocuticle structural glycoprotein SgAbd-5-like n=1 Tax=Ostrinia furnacalis TaxID=93504 RepID=UPI00103D7238|nr:endocuticle structural glycoprotein SgAbd-5-like [Ostrinia furnacalis]
MKSFAVLCLCAAVALAAPVEESNHSQPAMEHIHEQDDLGQYTLKYRTPDGTIVSERGRLVPTADGKDQVLIHEGSFSYIGDDGKTYVTKYKTDIAGAYQPEGDHLPKPVEPEPVPEVPVIA